MTIHLPRASTLFLLSITNYNVLNNQLYIKRWLLWRNPLTIYITLKLQIFLIEINKKLQIT